ncbi:MAG: FG-GAP-like repeat-containing protein [Planctomycetota bacterium]|jgi:hypothetical protein
MGFSVGGCLLAGAGAAVTADGQVTLTNWGVNADLVATHQPDETGIPVAQDWQTGGLAVGDFNNDGCQDIFWVGGGGTADKLFINKCNGTGTFTEQGSAWGLTDLHCGNGVAVGDYDGDGRLDIYVTSFGAPGSDTNEPGQHRLYHNDGGSFSEVAGAAGVTASCSEASGNPAGYGAAWGDYDLDGSLDLCVVSWWGDDDGNRLYHNDGDGTFTDVTDTALGTAIDGVWGFQPAFVDMDGDRFPELLIASDFQGSRYFVNNGDGTFTDFTGPSGTGLDDNGMGQTVADVNNDGLFDWYVTSIYKDTPPPANPGNMLYLNLGDHQYLEISGFAGVNDGAWGWGTLAVDLDHDTWVDILEVNGRLAEPWANEPARLFYNNGNVTFDDIAATAGFDHADEGRSVACLDADRDGDMDVLVSTNAGALTYYRNETPDLGNWLRIVLDTSTNSLLAPNGFGTRVIATVGASSYHRYLSGSPSYLATSEPTVHFGLGAATTVDELRFEWAKGYVTVMTDVAVNQQMTVVAPARGDTDGDGSVGIADFLDLLAAWGPCPDPPEPCLSDLDNDGEVGVADFLVLLASWD